MKNIHFKIYTAITELPIEWDNVSVANHFLQTPYLSVLEKSASVNMQCFFIGIFQNNELIGTSLAQYIDLNKLESFGERDTCFKTLFRNFMLKNFASHVVFMGNNMITGQNSYTFSKDIGFKNISETMMQCSQALIQYFKKKKIKIHLVSFKDFYAVCATKLQQFEFKNLYEFHTQPNMIFNLQPDWKSKDDYVASFTKKYRDQYKRARKKSSAITLKELSLTEVVVLENTLYSLYYYVAKNAPFNTFFLSKNHFSTFKKQCGNRFRVFGYFLHDKLIGFHTLLLNGKVLETYFLGYDEQHQKENMLYLNMLYNMTEFGIENQFEKIIFGRTALEIKSSIGAKPVYMSGFLFHTNPIINRFIGNIFPKLEPETSWNKRNPFK
ncbi:8-amino-7-oxononanoate synthase [Flavobacterium sp.]|uniref:8-amino-7-oxononanoate synthase n=1 Tax=Flavobacterium sp. TaxID=239 RepID=UPI0035293F47